MNKKDKIKAQWRIAIDNINSLEKELCQRRKEIFRLATGGKRKEAVNVKKLCDETKRKLQGYKSKAWRYEEEFLF